MLPVVSGRIPCKSFSLNDYVQIVIGRKGFEGFKKREAGIAENSHINEGSYE